MRRAALLLEVVVALAIMVTAMGLLSAQLVSGLRMTADAEELTRATQLADRMLAVLELDPNTVERFFVEREIDGDFDSDIYPQYRGWFWRATVEELRDNEGLGRVTIEILHQSDPEAREDIENAQIVRTLHLLKANPGRINLAEDFGVDEEQLTLLSEMIPIPGLDPTALDPQALVSLDPELLLEILPIILPLLQQFRGGVPGGGDLSPEMLRELLSGNAPLGDFSGSTPGAGGGMLGGDAALRELIQSQLGGQLSEEELNSLLSNVGQGGGAGVSGGGGRRPERLGGGEGGGGSRRGRTIEDLDSERDERNRRRGGR